MSVVGFLVNMVTSHHPPPLALLPLTLLGTKVGIFAFHGSHAHNHNMNGIFLHILADTLGRQAPTHPRIPHVVLNLCMGCADMLCYWEVWG